MSNNLELAQVAAAQNQKEVTINDQAGQLDAGLTETLTIEIDGSNAYLLTAGHFRRHFFIAVTAGSLRRDRAHDACPLANRCIPQPCKGRVGAYPFLPSLRLVGKAPVASRPCAERFGD
jgi:hypothetical protein